MGRRFQERRTDHASADEVEEMERQLWEFAKRPDPPGVPEAKLRPGAFLYRMHRTWHSLGRGSGIASHSFRALRDELLKRDPPVRNLQPKLYGTSALSQADASTLVDVMLETWHVVRGANGQWNATALQRQGEANNQPADAHDMDAICENLLHTLFKGEETLLLEEPVGVPPEIFLEERGRSSLALMLPTKGETVAHLSPSNIYGGFSSLNSKFIDAALERIANGKTCPLLIWVLRLDLIRDNAEFHQSFHSLAVYSASLTSWYFKLSKNRDQSRSDDYWNMIIKHCAFAVHGLPAWLRCADKESSSATRINDELIDLGPEFMVPYSLPIVLNNHRQVKKHQGYDFTLAVSLEPDVDGEQPSRGRLNYWIYSDRPPSHLEETADTTGLPYFDAEMSPGRDFDLAYSAIYEATAHHLGFLKSEQSKESLATLRSMGWEILTVEEFQSNLAVSKKLRREAAKRK